MFHKRIFKTLQEEGWPTQEMTLTEFEETALNAMNQYRQFVRDIPEFLQENRRIETPILSIASEDDRYLEEPSATEFDDIASTVVLRVVRGGHWIHLQQPERVARLLAEFWEKSA